MIACLALTLALALNMRNIKQILNAVFPFAITLLLWRMAAPAWNPCGILALVPIYYYSFVRPRDEFLPMAVVGCFLLDYNFDTMLFWTAAFCIAYSANYFQTVLRSAVQAADGLLFFSGFAGACFLILGARAMTWESVGTALWMLALCAAAYRIWGRIMRRME